MKNLFINVVILVFSFNCCQAQAPNKFEHYNTVLDAAKVIEKFYAGPVKHEELVVAAVNGMLMHLDPYGKFFNKEEQAKEQLDYLIRGVYGAIGVMISEKDGNMIITEIIDSSAAHRAGLQQDDKIIKINSTRTKGMSLSQLRDKITGEIGTKVEISVFRPSLNKELTYSLTREKRELEVVKSHMHNNICYIKLHLFTDVSAKQIRRVISDHMNKGIHIKGIILDLRNNPGGYIQGAIDIASYFVKSGIIVQTKYIDRTEPMHIDKDIAKAPNVPLVVLANEYSASASEMVIAAIKDNKRGVIVGTTSYGKGVGQTFIPFKDKLIKLTTCEFRTPNGDIVNKKGIDPDIKIEHTHPKSNEAKQDLKIHDKYYQQDNQYAKAIDYINGYILFRKTEK